MDQILSGLWPLAWWQYLVVALVLTHMTIVSVTIYLHRAMAHSALKLRTPLAHFFRFWLWLTTGMITKEWVAIHRKHHAKCEMEGDPHSPVVWLSEVTNKWKRACMMAYWVVWEGVDSYVRAARDDEMVKKLSVGTPNDWVERNLYSRFPKMGILFTMPLIDIALFGVHGIWIWVTQAIWIPVFAAGIINGIGHFFGYRNFESCHRKTGVVDSSRNIICWGILIGGEELHNNHHAHELSAKLSVKWFEFDIGWFWIWVFRLLGLVKSIRPLPH